MNRRGFLARLGAVLALPIVAKVAKDKPLASEGAPVPGPTRVYTWADLQGSNYPPIRVYSARRSMAFGADGVEISPWVWDEAGKP